MRIDPNDELMQEFSNAIGFWSLKFSDCKTEDDFLRFRLASIQIFPHIKLALGICVLIGLLSAIESIAELFEQSSLTSYLKFTYIFCILGYCLAILCEIVFACFPNFSICKGGAFLIFTYILSSLVNIQGYITVNGIVPLSIPLYLSCIVISGRYTFSWFTACISGVIGFSVNVALIQTSSVSNCILKIKLFR